MLPAAVSASGMIVMPRTLVSARLALRPPVAADAPALYACAGDPAVTRFLDWPTHEVIDDTHALIADIAWGWDAGDDYCWVLEQASDQPVIGTVGCQFDAHGAQIGYVIARDGWGRGLATEAAQAVFDAARGIDDVYRFWATCDIDNRASMRVLEKIGMHREAVLKRWSERPNLDTSGVPRDVVVYAWVR